MLGWKAENVVNQPIENIRLTNKEQQVVAVVSRTRIIRLIEILSRLQNVSGLTADLHIVQTRDGLPNAFATTKDGRNVVAISTSMVDLLEDDFDAHSAILGHELAHLVKQHGAESAAREAFLQALGTIAAVIINARTHINIGGVADLGVDLINKSYSRDEEREADEAGIRYMASAGFDPQGGIRLHQRLLQVSQTRPIPFLSTHPTGEERIANVQRLIASLSSSTVTKAKLDNTIRPQLASIDAPSAVKGRGGSSPAEGV